MTYKLICFASPYCSEMTKLSFKTKIYKKLKKINMLKPLAKLMSKNYNAPFDFMLKKYFNNAFIKEVKLLQDNRIAAINSNKVKLFDPSNDYHQTITITLGYDEIHSICQLSNGNIILASSIIRYPFSAKVNFISVNLLFKI